MRPSIALGLAGAPTTSSPVPSGPDTQVETGAANLRYLGAAVNELRAKIALRHAQDEKAGPARLELERARHEREEAAGAMTGSPPLERLAGAFGLTPFERDVLLLCAAREIEPALPNDGAPLSRTALDAGPPVTFKVAVGLLPDAHWDAIRPSAPLRRLAILHVEPGDGIALAPLGVDERILHYLMDGAAAESRSGGLFEELPEPSGELPPSHAAIVEGILAACAASPGAPPVIELVGMEGVGRRGIANAAARKAGLRLCELSPSALAQGPGAEGAARALTRELALDAIALLVDASRFETADEGGLRALRALLDGVAGPVFVLLRERVHLGRRPSVPFEVVSPRADEQRAAWRDALRAAGLPAEDSVLDPLVAHFDVGAPAIASACLAARATDAVAVARGDESDLAGALWSACRGESRPRLEGLAQRIESSAGWDDLVLPEAQHQLLREIAIHVRNRARVHDTWGFAARGKRGLGVCALFSGASGLGKTMAAEVLAQELRLDLYRIDLSHVVSKYIGETEKNLRRIFDAAESGGAVLLFDEADALFGKRSEVKDSHDRFANIEVSYLLQRIEAFGGLAILTTNQKAALDSAFLRRIRFVVPFSFPTEPHRAAMWARAFPRETPREEIDFERLARLNIAGGNIRNIAISAAFLAADEGVAVGMGHLMRAARTEYAKLERPVTAAEFGAGPTA